MIPLTFLYDEYIDRLKLSEQKTPFEYIVPPPQVGSEQQRFGSIKKLHNGKRIHLQSLRLRTF